MDGGVGGGFTWCLLVGIGWDGMDGRFDFGWLVGWVS